jgi:hypothetical protein
MKKPYERPRIEEWTVASLTQVGQSRPGGDSLPDQARGQEDGSIFPGGLS